MSEKEKQSRSLLYFAVGFCILMAAVAVMIFMFMHANRERITEQNRQYLEDAASQTVKRIDEKFEDASMSIEMVSRLYELQLTAPEFDYRLLNDMSEPTPFDYIRFVSPDGVSWAGDGSTADCRDREYFIDGMNGGSGICYFENSRFTQEPIIAFYTPLKYEGKIIGAVVGIIQSEKFSEVLDISFFGHPSDICVCTPDGDIVIYSWNDGRVIDERAGIMFHDNAKTDPPINEIERALSDGRPLSFRYEGDSGDGAAYIAPLASGKFMLVQTFPSQVSKAITSHANRDAFKLEIALTTIFVIYASIIAVYYIRRNHALKDEKEDLGMIVDSVKRLYLRFVVFDFADDSYEYLQEGNIGTLGLSPQGKYSEWLETFRAQHDKDPRFWGPMEDMTVDHLQQTLTKENWYSHREYPTPDGRWERLSLIKLDMDSDVAFRVLGAVEDITDTKKRDEESRLALEAAFRDAETASRAKSDFLSRMSHDIRTPMNAIIGLTAIMGAHLDDKDRIVDCLTKITYSSKHLLGLINEVLDMSKIESGKLILSEAEFSLSAMVDDVMNIVQPTINAKHQELTVRIHDINHEDVIGDSLRLQQVCVNILSNAVKYTGENGHISMDISERSGKKSMLSEYEFIIEDDGIGMTPEFLERIFTPFERAEDERVSGTQGTGLGMSIAQSIVRLMGGNITVESELHKGSKFTVTLSMKHQETNQGEEERLIGLPVLVADDEQIACETTCLMLTELGMNSEWVLSGREAVERVKEHKENKDDFFAVILDWKMPGMDGVETARAIRQAVGDEVPIIILSAYDWSEIEEEARAAGVNSFIGKPLFKSRLRNLFVNLVSDTSPEMTDLLGAIKDKNYKGKRALLVEDNALNQEIAEEILEMTGIEVDLAENGKVAADMFESSDPNYYDIIFMDIQMPIMNGYEATRAIRAMPRDDAESVPIVAMSANTFSEDVQESLRAGMVQHIGKPMGMDQLMAVLEKWLDKGEDSSEDKK